MRAEAYKQLSIKEFTKAAEIYDGGHAGIYEMCKDDYPPILEELRREPFCDLLDVGCGTGPMIELLSAEYPGARLVGLDLTPRMIEVAEAKGLPNARFVVGDAEDLPIPDEGFDVVICANSYHHYPHPEDFLAGGGAGAAPRRAPRPARLHLQRRRALAREPHRDAARAPRRARRLRR